jgi:hypothetical protein
MAESKYIHATNVQGIFDGIHPPSEENGLSEWELVSVVRTGRYLDDNGRVASMGDAEVVTFWKRRVDT